jgi:thiol-disulfide isomerase/thioredoxin
MDLPMKMIFTCMLCMLALLLTLLPKVSQAEIYKCTIAGKLVFTDQPCDGEKVTLGVTNSMAAEETPFEYVPLKPPYSSDKWYYGHVGYKRALRLFNKYDAPIFIYFQADWCKFCRKLEEGLIDTKKGKLALKKAIKVKISPEDSKRDDDFFRSLGGKGYPTLYLQADGVSEPQEVPTYTKKKMLSANDLSSLIAAEQKEQ